MSNVIEAAGRFTREGQSEEAKRAAEIARRVREMIGQGE